MRPQINLKSIIMCHNLLKAVVIGSNVKDIIKETFKYGAKEALVMEHSELKYYNTNSILK